MIKKLNIGCGKDIKVGYINLDYIKQPGVDVVHDLQKIPYPFKKNTFDEVYAPHIIEHLDDFIGIMKELHRIAKPGAKIIIRVPYFSAWANYADPTHKKKFSYFIFDYLTNSDFYPKRNEKGIFKIVKRRINYFPMNLKSSRFNFLFDPFLNLSPRFYERFLHGILPSAEIYVELKVLKYGK